MKVMGHRGAAGLALENTMDSFKMAKLLRVDSIELDVHITKDNKLVVLHDTNLFRISGNNMIVKNHTYFELKNVKLIDGKSYIPTLVEVIKATTGTDLIIEIKSEGCIEEIDKVIKKYKNQNFTIVSFKHNELRKLKKINPNVKIFASERTKPFEIIQFAKNQKLNGIFLNYWLLNPLTYFMAQRSNLEICVYTVNSNFIGAIIKFLYPKITICTDFPQRFLRNKTLPRSNES